LKHTEMLIEEAKQLNKHKGTLFSEEEIALQQGIAVALAATELNNERLTRTVGMIIYKNDKNYYQSRLRFLF